MDVAGEFRCVFIRFNQDSLESALEQVAGPFSLNIEVGRISSVYMPHDLRQVACRCLQNQVEMVVHQAVGMDDGVVTLRCRIKI